MVNTGMNLQKQNISMKILAKQIPSRLQGLWEGKILGIIANNESGATALFKFIFGFLVPTCKSIYVDYSKLENNCFNPKDTGFILETTGFLPNESSIKNLQLLASIQTKMGEVNIKDALKKADFVRIIKKHTGIYSMDMCEQLRLAQLIIDEHSFLILDEPFCGLDKQGLSDMRDLIDELRKMGKIVMLASHKAINIDELCDNVCEMETGKLVLIRLFVIQY